MSQIPIVVLTGFLGSGKTSLLNALLKDAAFRDSAVIVNEFGEIGLDHLLVASAKENIILLDAGCLCCAVLDSLKETLVDLYHRRVRSEVPEFKRVLIETTGLADPLPILRTIARDPLVSHFYRLNGLICAVDAVFGDDQLDRHPEAMAQAAVADRLIVTKTDLTGGECPPGLRRRLKSLNPSASIQSSVRGQAAAEALLPTSSDSPAASPPWLDDIGKAEDDHRHHESRHDQAVTAECFWLNQPITWAGVAAWTDGMRRRFGHSLLRCKAILNVVGAAGPVALHGVRDAFDTERLPAWPDDERRSRLVIIGTHLDRSALEAGLSWLQAPEGAQPAGEHDAPPPIPGTRG